MGMNLVVGLSHTLQMKIRQKLPFFFVFIIVSKSLTI